MGATTRLPLIWARVALPARTARTPTTPSVMRIRMDSSYVGTLVYTGINRLDEFDCSTPRMPRAAPRVCDDPTWRDTPLPGAARNALHRTVVRFDGIPGPSLSRW